MPSQKQQPSSAQAQQASSGSWLSFVPAGTMRSAAEYLIALIPGAVLLFAFFLAAEVAVLFLPGGSLLAASFLPVICIMPILSGVVSTLVLEKIRKKPLTMQRGALVGAASSFAGGLVSVTFLATASFLTKKYSFGESVTGLLFFIILFVILAIEAILGALGGALVAKFIKEI